MATAAQMDIEVLVREVMDILFEVLDEMGPGMLESSYQAAVAKELHARGIPFVEKPSLPAYYKGQLIARSYEPDFVIDGRIALELKSVEQLHGRHYAQVRTYLTHGGFAVGLLMNFGASRFISAFRRVDRPWSPTRGSRLSRPSAFPEDGEDKNDPPEPD